MARTRKVPTQPDNTGQKQEDPRSKTWFQPGVSPNPKGRPKGSRNKFGEDFMADFLASWQQHGAAVIAKVIEEKPSEYLKIAASILPKEMNVKVDALDDLPEDELATILSTVRAQIAAALRGEGSEEPPTQARH